MMQSITLVLLVLTYMNVGLTLVFYMTCSFVCHRYSIFYVIQLKKCPLPSLIVFYSWIHKDT